MIGGLLAYLLLTLGIDSLVELVKESGSWFIVEMTITGMLFGWVGALIWWLRVEGNEATFQKLSKSKLKNH